MTDDEVQALIARAEAVVGRNPPGNRSLKAKDGAKFHKEELSGAVAQERATQAEIAPLLSALDDAAVQQVLERYNAYNAQAEAAQSGVKRRWAFLIGPIVATFAAAVLLALIPHDRLAHGFAMMGLSVEDAARWAYLAPRMCVIGSLILVPLLSLMIDIEGVDTAWREARGTAEALRRKLFEEVLAAPASGPPGPIPLLLLKLEHFRRYQVEVQHAYHQLTAEREARTAGQARSARVAFILALLFWSLLFLGVNLSGAGEQALSPIGAGLDGATARAMAQLNAIETSELDFLVLPASMLLGCFFVALLLKQSIRGSRRNAVRHQRARDNFAALAGMIGPAREAAARGAPGAADTVRLYMDKVHSAMSAELADWVRLAALDIGKPSVETPAPSPIEAPVAAALPRAPQP